MSTPYEGFHDFVAGVPDLLQPILVAAAGTVPYIEGEGSAAFGVIAGLNPLVAGLAGVTGNLASVVLVILLSSRVRAAAHRPSVEAADSTTPVITDERDDDPPKTAKRRQRVRGWVVRFGVPGASLLAPIALPTQLTAATLVAAGVGKGWVLLWQAVAIVLWTGLVVAAATGILAAITG
ncbi:small multidrug efflux protein [Allosaccharopolyspora coralli]|uniref:Small multidrug efflux protein n=1 Tax=Allosaccharopolyspora coralli TaxID=2665642 RepID=A0A5Q3QBX7_9PSEU|nr:small multidrug efflux protein [Allosaccharopolyspora coralli]QGK69099.1 small multidrug efflux protein [Allosaccharopolyspora coralli]